MNELLEFLTSKEIIVVYIVAAAAILLCFIIYLVEKNNVKLRQKHNTRELNKLVSQIQEEVPVLEEEALYEEPVLEVLEEDEKTVDILEKEEVPKVDTYKAVRDEVIVDSLSIKDTNLEEELEYTSIEPDQATAQLELKKLTEELKRQEEEQNQVISLTNYEEQQEENAIISLEELVKKSKDMYEANELTQYVDEGNVPISLEELEKHIGSSNKGTYQEPFIMENVVPKEEMEEVLVEQEKMVLDDFQSVSTLENQSNKKFKNSPIISPIYGIEKKESNNDMELENTANYDKLDAEIKKTNEFLMSLRELQKKLD